MFNPLTPSQVVGAIGRAARDAARSDEPASEFARGQLMSAYSAARHLAVELESFAPELRSFADAVAADVRAYEGELAGGGDLESFATRLTVASDPQEIGDAVCELLAALRADDRIAAAALRSDIHRHLRQLADREVELLAEVIEGPQRS